MSRAYVCGCETDGDDIVLLCSRHVESETDALNTGFDTGHVSGYAAGVAEGRRQMRAEAMQAPRREAIEAAGVTYEVDADIEIGDTLVIDGLQWVENDPHALSTPSPRVSWHETA